MEINGYNAIKDIEAIVMQDKTSVQPNETFKLILIGSAGVGKSSLILRATTGKFSTEHNATIGVEFGSVLVKVGAETPAGEKLVRLQTWDTGGMESFRSLTRIFYKGAQVVFVVYDVSNLKSFTAIGEWLEEAKQYAGNEVKVFLIANKCDLSDKVVTKEMAMEFKEKHGLLGYVETSAKSGQNVKDIFAVIAKMLYVDIKEHRLNAANSASPGEDVPGRGIVINPADAKKPAKKNCC
eukprot:TRINITY_DN9262_c0_g1_i4.p2 TRINITY_DN9262_c0_g1~~TRINITY_DN9262_c0_g1_i4.p2  ORF type:complete len:238 (+),score=99.62 TRINITY_DN9262_c0_g1_i4:158-871(+)